jgi:hypothetical protein
MIQKKVEGNVEKIMIEKEEKTHHAYGDCASSFKEHGMERKEEKRKPFKKPIGPVWPYS